MGRLVTVFVLYLGGINLPSLYKHLQVSHQSQLLMSHDPCVQYLAEKDLQHDLTLSRKKFKTSVVVRDALAEDPRRQKSKKGSCRKTCPKCHKALRLDTHLKNSSTRKSVACFASSPTLTPPSEAVDHQHTPPSHESPPTGIHTSNTSHKPDS